MLPHPFITMLRHSLLANYAGQIATVSLGIVMVPAYVRYLGVEAYGLIALNAALQAWVQILDLGLSPTLCRELARAQDEASRKEAGVLLQSLEKFVAAMCALLLVLSVLAAPYFAKDWLHAGGLPVREIEIAFALMMLTASSRWLSSVYRAGMVGVDRQGTLNAVVVGFAVIRAALVVPVIARWPQIEVFFLWQLGAILGESLTMRWLLGREIKAPLLTRTFSRATLSARAGLSLSIAFSALVWAATTQIDKVILSKVLSLQAFGEFSLAALLASGILLLANPIQQAFIPHFAAGSVGESRNIVRSYLLASEITMIVVIPLAMIFAIAPDLVLRLWSATAPSAPRAWRVLQCYAVGNACSAIAELVFLVQCAQGNLSMQIKGNVGFLVILVPAFFFGALNDGAVGVAYAWLALSLIRVLVWVSVVHRKFLPGINMKWYREMALRVAATGLVGLLFHSTNALHASRTQIFLFLLLMWLSMMVAVVAVSPISQRKARSLAGRLVFN